MKYFPLLICLFIIGCKRTDVINKDNIIKTDTVITIEKPVEKRVALKVYSNERFQNVSATKVSDSVYNVKGKGQIFEAAFSWVVEDGHNELKKGHEMTDAGAPEWGNFSFDVEVKKERENSTLTLILFESSAKDGSRQYELPIVLN